MAPAASRVPSAVSRLLSKFSPAALPPKTVQYFSILLLLRVLLAKRKIPRRQEDMAYILFLAPAVMTIMHTWGRSKWPMSMKYRLFLDKTIWPTSVSPRYEVLQGCHQTHPKDASCTASMIKELPMSFRGVLNLYLRFYLVQFAVTYLIQAAVFFASESQNRWLHFQRDLRKRREREEEQRRFREAAEKGDVAEEDADEAGKPLRKIDSAVDVGALGSFTSMTGMRSTHVGRDRFVRPDSPLPTKAGKPALPAKQDDDSLQMAMHKRMLARRRRSSIVPPPVVPLTSSSFREFFLWFFFDSLPEQLFRYAEAVARSTAFFFSACAIGRALFCVIGALDKRLTGKELADVSKRTLLVYLCNVISNSPMVLERHSRVAIVNRMMATYLLGELLPATKASAWLGALGAVAATAYTAKGRLGNLAMGIFSAAWSAVEM